MAERKVPCGAMTKQMVPDGWDFKEVDHKCGQTGIDGNPLYCPSCSISIHARGHTPYECRHGVDMRPEGSFCSACEYE